MPKFPPDVRIVEVGPRDGLQNEAVAVPTQAKIVFIKALSQAGLKHIEAGSFVHPKLVPQLADAEEFIAAVSPAPAGVTWSALVPNGCKSAASNVLKRPNTWSVSVTRWSRRTLN